ncbi:MAG: DUF2723 domain-containing protein [Chloroflexota bacterium]|nr:DUF2723 domain-containing protein [Chloroflexota bacterium]
MRQWPAQRATGIGAAGVALGGALLYGATLAPGLGGTVDSAEFQQAAAGLSLVHPTGYPLYLLLAHAWIALLPLGEVAWRVNVLSALFGVATLLVIYATVRHLSGSESGAVLAAALAATHPLVWPTAVVAEVTSLNELLVAATLYALLRWAAPARAWPLEAGALLYGLALSHHRTSLLLAPAIALFLAWTVRRGRRVTAATMGRSLLLLALPALAYLYLPLRAFTTAWYTNTWANFATEVGGAGAWPVIVDTLQRPLLPRVGLVGGLLAPGWAGGLIVALAALGGVLWSRRIPNAARQDRWPTVALYTLSFLTICGVMVIYDVAVIGDYLALAALLPATWAGVGAGAWLRLTAASARMWRGPLPVGVLLLALALVGVPVAQAVAAYPQADFHAATAPRQFWTALAGWEGTPAALPPDTILIGGWARVNELRYRQRVEGWRPDLYPVVLDDLLAGRLALIREWLGQGRAVYLLDSAPAVTAQYAVTPQGPLWRVERPLP